MTKRTSAPLVPERNFEDSDYLVRSALEIRFLLRAIREQKALVVMHFPDNNEVLFTCIVDVDAERGDLVLDYPNNEQTCRRALAAETLICTTTHDEVKVQFKAEALRKVRHKGRDELCCDIPEALLRVQRRNSFRVQTPQADPLKCVIHLPDGIEPPSAEVIVLDISCGGIAVIDHHPRIAMEPGMIYEHCEMVLPGIGEVEFKLQVKDTFTHTLRNGLNCKRVGCAFVDMHESTRAAVQRYIILRERELRAFQNRAI